MSGASAKFNGGDSKHNAPSPLVCRRESSPDRDQYGPRSVGFSGGTNVWRCSKFALPWRKQMSEGAKQPLKPMTRL